MANQFIRIGSMIDVFGYDDVDFDSAIETTEPIKAGPPVDPTDVIRLEDLEGRLLSPVSAVNIDNPTELNSVAGVLGALVLAYQIVGAAGLNEYTLYAYDADGPAVAAPYVMDADGAGTERWIAVCGKYSIVDPHISGNITITGNIVIAGTVDGTDISVHVANVDAHHSQLHTIASHSDTTATGAELETLTDGSNADALHEHAHAATTGRTTDDHHAQVHDVDSHSDVDLTGLVNDDLMQWDDPASDWQPKSIAEVILGQNISPGDIIFTVAGSGLCFGSCYVHHGGWVQLNAVQNTWYNVSDAGFVSGPLNNVTHDGNGKLTVANAGIYKVEVSLDWENNTVNDHIEIGFEVSGSGSAETHGIVCSETKFANEEHMGETTAMLDLAANATIELAIRTTDNNTPTISVDCVSLNCVQIGEA